MSGFSKVEKAMVSDAPSQIMYSTLFSSENYRRCLPGISENFSTKEPCCRPDSQIPQIIPRAFLIRVGLFVLLELGFITLASAALLKPILLPISNTVTEAKGAITIIAIIWHALAVYMVKDILLIVFSAEWTEQYQFPQSSAHQESDIVSRLTTRYIDQIKHVFSRRATLPFRLGFVSSLFLIMINPLGPSAVSVDFVPHQYPLQVKVANITPTSPLLSEYIDDRAKMIIRLEQMENTTYGFSPTQSNILVPWPSRYSIPFNATIRYQTDVIKYNFSCSWKNAASAKPSTNNVSLSDAWTLDNEDWYFHPSPMMEPSGPIFEPLILPSYFSFSQQSTCFMFAGSNRTFKPRGPGLDLEGIPSFLLRRDPDSSPVLVSFLQCDPRLQVLPATVNVTQSFLGATILPGKPIVNNISPEAASLIFSGSLSAATSEPETITLRSNLDPNVIARLLFLPDTKSLLSKPKKPSPVEQISQRMNMILLSSSKAYMSGYEPNIFDEANPIFGMVDTDAIAEVKKMALVGSKPFLIALTAVVGFVTVLLAVLLVMLRGKDLQTFTLENVLKALQPKDPARLRID